MKYAPATCPDDYLCEPLCAGGEAPRIGTARSQAETSDKPGNLQATSHSPWYVCTVPPFHHCIEVLNIVVHC